VLRNICIQCGFLVWIGILFAGCQSVDSVKDLPRSLPVPHEAEWIRNGEPIEFEGGLWFPNDNIENFLNTEVYQVGEFKELPVYVEAIDVRPFERLYTKFNRNQYRSFEKM